MVGIRWKREAAETRIEQMSLLILLVLLSVLLGFYDGMEDLEETAPKTPHIHGLIVFSFNHRDFWCSVTPCTNMTRDRPFLGKILLFLDYEFSGNHLPDFLGVVRFLLSCLPKSPWISWTFAKKTLRKSPRDAKVANFNLTFLVDQYVVRFYVSVDNVCTM